MCDKNLVFPAVIKKDGEGYFVYFPDLEGCFTDGENILEAYVNAKDALALYLHDLKTIPQASDIEEIDSEGGYVMLVDPDKQDNIEYLQSVDITEILTKAMREKGYTKYRVAKLLGLSESYVNRIVAGDRQPSTEVAQKISALLEIDWRVFFPVQRTTV